MDHTDPRKVIVEKQETINLPLVAEDESLPRTSLPYLSSINRDEFHTTPSHAFTFSRSSSFSNEKQQHFNIPQKKGRFYRSVSDTTKQNRAENKMTSRKDTPMKPKRVFEKRDPKKIIDDLGKFRSKRKDATRKKTNTEDSKIVFNNFSITETDWKEVFKNTVKNPGIVLKSPQSLLKSQTAKNKITSAKPSERCHDITIYDNGDKGIKKGETLPMKNPFATKSQQMTECKIQNNSYFKEQQKPLYNNDVFLGESSNSIDLEKTQFHNQSNYLQNFSHFKTYLHDFSQLPDFSQIQDTSQFQDASLLQCDSKFEYYLQNPSCSHFQYDSKIQDNLEINNSSRVPNYPNIQNNDQDQKSSQIINCTTNYDSQNSEQFQIQDCKQIQNCEQDLNVKKVQDFSIQDCTQLQRFSVLQKPLPLFNENSVQNIKILADIACKHEKNYDSKDKPEVLPKIAYSEEVLPPMSKNDSELDSFPNIIERYKVVDNEQTFENISFCEVKNEDEIKEPINNNSLKIDIANSEISSNTSIKVLEDLEDLDKYIDFNPKYDDNIIKDLCQILDNKKEKEIIDTVDLVSAFPQEEKIEMNYTKKSVKDTNGKIAEIFEDKTEMRQIENKNDVQTIKNNIENNYPFKPSTTEEFLDYYEKFLEDLSKQDKTKITSEKKNKRSKKNKIQNKIIINFNLKNASDEYVSKMERSIHKIRNTVDSNSFDLFYSKLVNFSNLKIENGPTTKQIFIEPKNTVQDSITQTSITDIKLQNSASQTSIICTKDQETYVDFNTTENNDNESKMDKKDKEPTTESEENRIITVMKNQHALIIQYLKQLNNKLDENKTAENNTDSENTFYADIEHNAVKKLRTYSKNSNILSEIQNNYRKYEVCEKVGERSRNNVENDIEIVVEETNITPPRANTGKRRLSERVQGRRMKSSRIEKRKAEDLSPNISKIPRRTRRKPNPPEKSRRILRSAIAKQNE